MTTLQRLQAVLQKDFAINADLLHPETRLESLAIDSLMMIEILFCVEDEFKISIPSGRAELSSELQTVADLVDYIDALISAQRAALA